MISNICLNMSVNWWIFFLQRRAFITFIWLGLEIAMQVRFASNSPARLLTVGMTVCAMVPILACETLNISRKLMPMSCCSTSCCVVRCSCEVACVSTRHFPPGCLLRFPEVSALVFCSCLFLVQSRALYLFGGIIQYHWGHLHRWLVLPP